MLWYIALFALFHISAHAAAVPTQSADPAPLPPLKTPVACRKNESRSSDVVLKYDTAEGLFGSLTKQYDAFDEDGDGNITQADLDEIEKSDEDHWVSTDDDCFISADKAMDAVPDSLLNEVMDSPVPRSVEKRPRIWGIVVRVLVNVGSKVVKKIGGKAKPKGRAPKGPPRCKRGPGGCSWGEYIKTFGTRIGRERASKATGEAQSKMRRSLETDNENQATKLQKEGMCLTVVGQVFDEFGYDAVQMLLAGGDLAEGGRYANIEQGGKNHDKLKELHDSVDGGKPNFNRFTDFVSDFLQKCAKGKIPKPD